MYEMNVRYSTKAALVLMIGSMSMVLGCWAKFDNTIIGRTDHLNTFELLSASSVAYKAGRIEDAGFLLFAGKARYQIDKQVFYPRAGENPGILKSALTASVGQAVQADLENDPIAFLSVVNRLGKWSPKYPDAYDPGWKYKKRLDTPATKTVLRDTLKPIVSAAKSKATLAQNEEYAKLSQVIKDAAIVERKFWAAQRGKRKRGTAQQKEYRQAMATRRIAAERMKEIEFESCPDSRWDPEDYFDAPQVIALCQAIGNNDLKGMKRLLANGANVNAVGDGGMTPLLWAFPDRKIERFRILLENGANPNVTIDKGFGVRGRAFHPGATGGSFFLDRGCPVGGSVTHLAARSPVLKYLELVLKHGGDPNLVNKENGMTPLDVVLDRSYYTDLRNRVELLISKGADINHYCQYKGVTPAMLAVIHDKFEIAILLLEAGANPKLYRPDNTEKLVHFVARSEQQFSDSHSQLAAEFTDLVKWLEQNGESLEQARADCASWKKQYKKAVASKDYARIRRQIIDEQKRTYRPEAKPLEPMARQP